MSTEEPFSREKFRAIFSQCMDTLKRHGFVPPPAPEVDLRFIDVFERSCSDWFDHVTPKQVSTPPKKIELSQKQMDEITLECARFFVEGGVKYVHGNESLNCIRGAIVDVLKAMGYEDPGMFYVGPLWGCYKNWEEGARLGDCTDDWIRSVREWYKKSYPDLFEAA